MNRRSVQLENEDIIAQLEMNESDTENTKSQAVSPVAFVELSAPSAKNNNIALMGEAEESEVEERFAPSTVVRKMKTSSVCWDFLYFKGSKSKGADKSKVFCKLCSNSTSLPYNNSTSNLIDHMKRHHRVEYEKAEKPQGCRQ